MVYDLCKAISKVTHISPDKVSLMWILFVMIVLAVESCQLSITLIVGCNPPFFYAKPYVYWE